MLLNYIWIAFFLIAFAVALVKLIFLGDTEVFKTIIDGTFDTSKTAFEISIGLTGIMTLWLGILNIGEKAGAIRILSKVVSPFFSRIFPKIPKDHPALGQIVMNFTANMLGLGNAATPLGLKAMQGMQELNEKKDTASDPQIMFLVLNTAGFTLLPVTIMLFRAQLGAKDPSDIFIPILLATFVSSFIGVLAVALRQKIKLMDPVLLSWGLGICAFVGGLVFLFSRMDPQRIAVVSRVVSNLILFTIITAFIAYAFYKKVHVYDAFIEGAKNGFETAVKLIPYLVAMLVAIGVFRSSGAMDFLIRGIGHVFAAAGFNTDFVSSLPTALMKPLSGSGARGMMIDTMKTYGTDSFAGRLSSIIQGSADTTFYIVALYFGSVGITKTRYSIAYGLLTDLAGLLAAIFLAYLFFGKMH
ncbi:MAG TPA: nucleoside recognition domain-containing protein [Bacteroidia bacterium]|jgi:spore maturation protein SpmA|nr:nucleoside recognition domain-containing protein [Bacteroidia bacterium]